MSKLLELADRVEALTGPDREVDAAIAKALGWRVLYDAADPSDRIPYYQPDPDRSWTAVPLYSFSLDAAMTLVPEGWRLSGLEEIWRTGQYRAQISPRPSEKMLASFDAGRTVGWETCDCLSASTPAIALCAAALRARHAVEGEA